MLAHRLRRRPNIGPTFGRCVVFAGYVSPYKQDQAIGDSFAAYNLPIADDFELFFKTQRESTCKDAHDSMFIYKKRVLLFCWSLLSWIFIDTGLTLASGLATYM